MSEHDYVLRGVEPLEYRQIKERESELVDLTFEGFNDHWKPRVQDIEVLLKYNPQRRAVGIFLDKDGQKQLVIGRQGLNEEENVFVGSLYGTLERELDTIRLPNEEWVEYLEGDDKPREYHQTQETQDTENLDDDIPF
jgi:hypothetical protein